MVFNYYYIVFYKIFLDNAVIVFEIAVRIMALKSVALQLNIANSYFCCKEVLKYDKLDVVTLS